MSDIMSDMKTASKKRKPAKRSDIFTVRDMNRRPAELLNACDNRGTITIRSRNGRTYQMSASRSLTEILLGSGSESRDALRQSFSERLREHHKQMAAMGYRPPSAADQEKIDRMIAGE